MKYPSESALQNHFLESILPHSLPQQKQFLKTKDFYQPQKFIWNNPHRVSSQMYKFYHIYNDKYHRVKEPTIRQQEDQDRKDAEIQRILRLTAFRNKTRQLFQEKQKNRESLQQKTRKNSTIIKNDNGTISQIGIHTQKRLWPPPPSRFIPTASNFLPTQSVINEQKYNSITGLPDPLEKEMKSNHHSERIMRIENSYQKGVQKFDERREQIGRLIYEQTDQYHRRVREEFNNRKNYNLRTKSKLQVRTRPI